MSEVKFTEIIKKQEDLGALLDNETEYNFDLVHSVKKNIFKIMREIRDIQESLPEDKNEKEIEEDLNDLKIEIDWYPIKKENFPEKIKPNELPISIIDLIE